MESKRINKYISETGYCSRREADKLIESGSVTINGKVAESGSQVFAGQVVKVYGETIKGGFRSVILAYNKPVGVVSTTDSSDPENIVNAIGFEERIFPIGRLDKDSQGLILMTNEGDLVNKILRVGNNHDKEYLVVVDKPIDEAFIKGMQSGVPILGIVTRKCEITQVAACVFTIVLRQGLNRQIRRMCEHFGYKVEKLERTRIMHIKLGNLKQGQYRHLTAEEEKLLREKTDGSVKTEEASRAKPKQKIINLPPLKLKDKAGASPLKGKTAPVKDKTAFSKDKTTVSKFKPRAGSPKSIPADEIPAPDKKRSKERKTLVKSATSKSAAAKSTTSKSASTNSVDKPKTRNANKASHKSTAPKSKTSGQRIGKSRPDKVKAASKPRKRY